MLIGTPSAKRFCGIEGEDWEELYDDHKEMSRTVGVRKPQEAQKAKALWKMKAAKVRKKTWDDEIRRITSGVTLKRGVGQLETTMRLATSTKVSNNGRSVDPVSKDINYLHFGMENPYLSLFLN